ncbi:hypothetical protein CDO52_16250 [Nocardiopsis gilva YIM 90087]|uniref:Uncharacterized protein n=1 Tax=Nocardiopsis gilva YIM 90087 TaxID=1235441 RepID=A0A223S7P6_9ACTN|nr:hypothetical protein [Nocardiopsis gilva]ASU84134.1 hypothetical protein CDO52_16250 [Nocardiopsis gilva YIM 90087]
MSAVPSARPSLAWLAAATATVALLSLGTAAAPAYPGHTVSRYVPLSGGSADTDRARSDGCTAGTTGRSGVRILFFGTQESGGRLRPPGTTAGNSATRVPASRAIDAAAAWARGFSSCRARGATATLALGVNNKDDGGVGGAGAGRAWARIVQQAASAAENPAVSIAGAVDAEPGWSSPGWGRGWVRAFTSATSRTLYAAGAAGGCPTYGAASVRCNNGWTVPDVYFVAAGAAPTIRAIPQIYRTDGIQARQWAHISSWGAKRGSGTVRFAGSLSQYVACQQRSGCATTDNTAKAAWTQLRDELNAHPETRVSALPNATDVRWP